MGLRFFLVALTFVAVVCDSMLVPFYPQFFAEVFAVANPQHVGAYVAATCFMVMLTLPLWAAVAQKLPVLRLLVYTQVAAGVLSVLCVWAPSLLAFWVISLGMFAFKGSYLLIYPYAMSLETKEGQVTTIGLLSVMVHFGGILGAVVGGLALELFAPQQIFLLMAAGDFLQTLMCRFLLRRKEVSAVATPPHPEPPPASVAGQPSLGFVYKLGLVMLVFYFSAFLIRPFFSVHWEAISSVDNKIVSGLVFAIPALAALLALWHNHRTKKRRSAYSAIVSALLLGTCGVLLQAAEHPGLVILGRCLFGWALFHSTVRLDLLLFELSPRASYATGFSKINFFQQLGVLVSSFAAGSLVTAHGLQMPFVAAAVGFVVTILCVWLLFGAQLKAASAIVTTPGMQHER